jgi:PAS domain S-box-containing protein
MSGEKQITILLVDDELTTAVSDKMALEKYGYQVITANSGEEAITAVEKNPGIDLILMDIDLGAGMDGTEAARIILWHRDLPVIFLSGHTDPSVVEKTKKITSYGYVVKDSSSTVLDASIKMAFKLFEAKKKEQEKYFQAEAVLEALKKNEERMQDIIFSLADWAWEVDENGVYNYSSEKGSTFLGFSREEIIDKKPFDFMPADEAKRMAAIFSAITANKAPIKDLENWNIGKNGERICLLTNGVPILDEKGNLKGYRGVDKDITANKQIEKLTETLYKISQSIYEAENLNELFAHVHHALSNIIPTDNLFIALLADDGKSLRFPYFIDEKDIGDRSTIELDNAQSLTVEVFKTKRSLLLDEMELAERYASGKSRVWGTAPKCWLGVPLMIRDRVIGVMAVQDYHKRGAYTRKDVTLLESTAGQIALAIDRKRAEEEIKRQLAEKQILLEEVHHRIKNNIASISGFLSLHLRSVSHPEALAALQDAIGRINSMGILYEKLLGSESYKDVSVKNYVESLIDTIVAMFPGKAKITLDKHITDFHLDPKRLFSLGIIINELLTNILKYAFPSGDSGLIRIFLVNAGKHVTLTMQDSGDGLPEGFDINLSKGFGLRLVKMLSKQLGGSFVLENQTGTRSRVEFYI